MSRLIESLDQLIAWQLNCFTRAQFDASFISLSEEQTSKDDVKGKGCLKMMMRGNEEMSVFGCEKDWEWKLYCFWKSFLWEKWIIVTTDLQLTATVSKSSMWLHFMYWDDVSLSWKITFEEEIALKRDKFLHWFFYLYFCFCCWVKSCRFAVLRIQWWFHASSFFSKYFIIKLRLLFPVSLIHSLSSRFARLMRRQSWSCVPYLHLKLALKPIVRMMSSFGDRDSFPYLDYLAWWLSI